MKRVTSSIFAFFFCFSVQAQWTTSGTNIYNSNTGNVGIGTTSPAYTLDVNGNARVSGGLLYLAGNYNGINATCLSTHIFNKCGSGGFVTLGFNLTTGAGTSTPDPLTIKQSNLSVGINNNNPLAKLHISGGGTTNTSSSFLVNNSAGTEVFRIWDNGNLGIAAASDNGNKLQVNGNLWTTGIVLPTGAGAGKVLTSDANGNATWQTAGSSSGWALGGNTVSSVNNFGTVSNYDLAIITNNVERMRVTAAGAVAIGTTNPQTYMLAVNGSAIFTQAVVKLYNNWPDYVFQKDYPLTSLDSVARYIEANNHLPDLPTAAMVEKSGIDLGGNQAALVKKIEELTLYLIEEHKKVQEYEEKFRAQEVRLERLERLLKQ